MFVLLVPQDHFDKVSPAVRNELKELDDYLGGKKKIYVTSAFREGDANQHGKGLALDLLCPELSLMDFFFAAARFDFTGIGVYPHWQLTGKVVGGLHVDMRAAVLRAFWMGATIDGKQQYLALDWKTVGKYVGR